MKTTIQLLEYIIPAVEHLNDIFLENITNFLDTNLNSDKIKFSVFIILLFLVFLVIWSPYLNNLNTKIWRTKGMLNMIPMDIISKNENLKNAFISGDILQAVK
mmetsp:Transcript_69131/g.104234  ORF Transcript_69131/g.104234 Transcript_69131/m.104234 type:complete len:103 (+) Transcript_69131:599-907(+)